MRKRKSIALIGIVALILVVLVGIVFFNTNDNNELSKYDKKILNEAKEVCESFPKVEGRSYSVVLDGNTYIADINGELVEYENSSLQSQNIVIEEFEDITDKKMLSIIQDSKSKIFDYISESNILVNKEEIKTYIEEIEFYYVPNDYVAMYKDGIICIGKPYIEKMCEWSICHELIHAITDFTRSGEYGYEGTLFNETMTDIIAYSLEPKITDGISSQYMDHYDNIMLYLGAFGEKAIQSYFYGYGTLLKEVSQEELDLFVYTFECYWYQEMALININNFLNKYL